MPIPAVAPVPPRSPLARAWAAFGRSGAGHWYVRKISPHVDPWLHNVSRGRVTSVAVFPVVLLTTTGRKSGEQRTTPLLYFTDGDRVVVIASNYGQKHHPAWYLNIRANPEVTMSAGGVTARYVGREATGDERERIWNTATQYVDNYRQYEATTGGRRIPVLVFTPVEARERRFERGGAGDTTADSPA